MSRAAKQLAQHLFKHHQKTGRPLQLVFAESCTAGLCSALMAQIPGISEHLCGSMAVYQLETKARWLGVKSHSGVSQKTTETLARKVLRMTPHADYAAAVTGFLSGNTRDGEVWISVCKKPAQLITTVRLNLGPCSKKKPLQERTQRQRFVADAVLRLLDLTLPSA